MHMGKRPASVTIIAWIFIVASGLNLVNLSRVLTQRKALQFEIADKVPFWAIPPYADFKVVGKSEVIVALWSVVAGAIGLISGIAILKGLNWGRLLYLFSMPISIVLTWLHGFHTIDTLKVIFYVIFLVFLTRPAASLFFARRNSEE